MKKMMNLGFAFVLHGKDLRMIESLCVVICKELLPILSMEDVDDCKDHFCIGNAFYVSICGGSFSIEAIKDSLCSEVNGNQETKVLFALIIVRFSSLHLSFSILDW